MHEIAIVETWKDIKGFNGYHQISNYGRVKSFYKYKKVCNGYIRKLSNSRGYKCIRLPTPNNKNKVSFRVHRLVAQAFIPNYENKPYINHIDFNKSNNHISNLEWVTPKENSQHSIRFNKQKYTIHNYFSHENIKNIIDYYEDDFGMYKICLATKTPIKYIKKILKENGIKIRTLEETRKLQKKHFKEMPALWKYTYKG